MLGDHDVHIVKGFHWYDYDAPTNTSDAYSARYRTGKSLQHYICVHEQSAVATYQQWKADMGKGSAEPVNHGKHENDCIVEYQCDKCKNPSSCEAIELHRAAQLKKKLQLALLRTCRQIYVEANEVLWGTNTFSFGGTRLLRDFIAQRNAMQKQMLRKIFVKWDNSCLVVKLPMATINALSGIRVLHLSMETTFISIHEENSTYRNQYINSVLALRLLAPLEVVTVTFDTYVIVPTRAGDLPPTQQLEIAEGIRSRLLDTNDRERL